MPVSFEKIKEGQAYDRPSLARMWGYRGYNAIARGVVTPRNSDQIILFITAEKQSHLHPYRDMLVGSTLSIEGERNHLSDQRLVRARENGDHVHLFFRGRHHEPFVYYGEIVLTRHELFTDTPSRFVFSLGGWERLAENIIATDERTHGTPSDFAGDQEGKVRLRLHREYERSVRNRAEALRIHGTVCKACGFDFDAVYGAEHARHFIQIHHVESVTKGIRIVDPKTALVPLCSNCHSMAHRQSGRILSVAELKELLSNNRNAVNNQR